MTRALDRVGAGAPRGTAWILETGPGRSRRSQGDGPDTGHWTRKEQETGESA